MTVKHLDEELKVIKLVDASFSDYEQEWKTKAEAYLDGFNDGSENAHVNVLRQLENYIVISPLDWSAWVKNAFQVYLKITDFRESLDQEIEDQLS